MYSQPRFQLTGASIAAVEREMPGPFELISLSDTERIEQILTRIDVFPTNYHIDQLFDLLHRVTGLPPIVWGMIANAQTVGRALTASWKATETRLAPKLMQDEHSIRRWDAIVIDYIRQYDWEKARNLFTDRRGLPFLDFTYDFPPMEPRDFQEVTMNAITKRDAGLIPSVQAMRETGDEKAEDTIEEVKAEWMDPVLHPDKVQARELLRQISIQNDMAEQEIAAQQAAPAAPAAPAGAPAGAPPALPPGVPPGAVPGGMPPGAGARHRALDPHAPGRDLESAADNRATHPAGRRSTDRIGSRSWPPRPTRRRSAGVGRTRPSRTRPKNLRGRPRRGRPAASIRQARALGIEQVAARVQAASRGAFKRRPLRQSGTELMGYNANRYVTPRPRWAVAATPAARTPGPTPVAVAARTGTPAAAVARRTPSGGTSAGSGATPTGRA